MAKKCGDGALPYIMINKRIWQPKKLNTLISQGERRVEMCFAHDHTDSGRTGIRLGNRALQFPGRLHRSSLVRNMSEAHYHLGDVVLVAKANVTGEECGAWFSNRFLPHSAQFPSLVQIPHPAGHFRLRWRI